MQRRPYRDRDLRLLQDTVAGWIETAGRRGYDHIGELPHRIYENLRGRYPVGEVVHLWESDSTVVGVAICGRFGSSFDLVLAPNLRGTSDERELLADAAATTQRFLGPGEEFIGTDVFASDVTRQRALWELGFERFRIWDDLVERTLENSIVTTNRAGFAIRSARADDADRLAAAHTAAFPDAPPWTGNEYRAEVMDKPGYDAEREIVAVAPDGRLGAYAVLWLDQRNRLGHLEPVGTHPDFRRRGLARSVLSHAMERMRAAGMDSVSLTYDADNVPAGRLYESLGFVHCDQTFGYRRRAP